MSLDIDTGVYPTSWKEFIGQDQAKLQLQLAIRSAKKRRTALDHVLLSSGVPGIGKTALALLTAREMGKQVVTVSGPLDTTGALMTFADLEDGDVLFIDEAHRLVEQGKRKAEWLLHYLQDGVILTPFGEEKVPNITVIAATTEAGKLSGPLLSRFTIRPQLVGYTEQQAAKIAAVMARKIMAGQTLPSTKNCRELAAAANRNPRSIRRLLITLRDLGLVHPEVWDGTHYDVSTVLTYQGLTSDGLDDTAQKYLRVLAFEFGGTAGERALKDRLQEPGGIGEVEVVLVEKGLIGRTKTGRMLTGAGAKRAKELAA